MYQDDERFAPGAIYQQDDKLALYQKLLSGVRAVDQATPPIAPTPHVSFSGAPVQSEMPTAAQRVGDKGIDWLALGAAYTRNPALMEQLHQRNENKLRESDLSNKWRDQELDRKIKEEELAGRTAERTTKLQSTRESLDPNSATSESARATARESYLSRAEILAQAGLQKLAEVMQNRANGVNGKTAAQLAAEEAQTSKIMGEALRQTGQGLQAEALANGILGRQGQLGLGYAQLNEQSRHNQQTEQLNKAKIELKTSTPPLKIEEALRDAQRDSALIDESLKLLDTGKAPYTGTGAQTLNQAKNIADSALSAMGAKSRTQTPDEQKFLSNVGQVKAMIRKPIYGAALSKFDIKDAAEFIPGQGDSDNRIRQKLLNFKRLTEFAKEMLAHDYKQHTGNDYIETTPKGFGGGQAPTRRAAPKDAKPGQTVRSKKDGKTYRVTADLMLEEVQ